MKKRIKLLVIVISVLIVIILILLTSVKKSSKFELDTDTKYLIVEPLHKELINKGMDAGLEILQDKRTYSDDNYTKIYYEVDLEKKVSIKRMDIVRANSYKQYRKIINTKHLNDKEVEEFEELYQKLIDNYESTQMRVRTSHRIGNTYTISTKGHGDIVIYSYYNENEFNDLQDIIE